MNGIFEKILLAALAVVMAIGISTTIYAVLEHGKVTAATAQVEAAKLETAQSNANAAAAASDAAATRAAYDAQANQITSAKNNHAASTAKLASAVAASPAAAQAEVSADIWDAIYGSSNAAK